MFVLVTAAAHLGLSVGMDTSVAELRDPEYGRRLVHLRALPCPLPVALGSSRVAVGVRGSDSQPVFNLGTVGGGPLMSALMRHRLEADGVRPSAVLVEFWPPYLRQDGEFSEERRLDPHRLLAADRPFVRDQFEAADHTLRLMAQFRRLPWYEHRGRLLNQLLPHWLPDHQRLDGTWAKLDRWGWRPGPTVGRMEDTAGYYRRLFDRFAVSPAADRAYRDLLTRCRAAGVPVRLVWLPESTAFRTLYPPSVLEAATAYLEQLSAEFGVPVTDARGWVPDAELPDGFHLSPAGAERFTRRLAEGGP